VGLPGPVGDVPLVRAGDVPLHETEVAEVRATEDVDEVAGDLVPFVDDDEGWPTIGLEEPEEEAVERRARGREFARPVALRVMAFANLSSSIFILSAASMVVVLMRICREK